jgi:hypothetical protein
MTRSIATLLATYIGARSNCTTNPEWFQKWTDRVSDIMDHAPSGSGFDNGTEIDLERSNENKLVFTTDFHHMNSDGYYEGWTSHTVTVTPSFISLNIKVSGKNKNNIKDHIHQAFYDFLHLEVADVQ